MSILALDLATCSGFAVVAPDGVVTSGHWQLDAGIPAGKRDRPTPEARNAIIVSRLRQEVRDLLTHSSIAAVAIERDFGRGAGGRLLACLQNAAQEAALDAGVPALSIPLSTWRSAVHGKPAKGHRRDKDWFKDEAKRLCAASGRDVESGDEAEAILIGRYAVANVRFHAAPERRAAA